MSKIYPKIARNAADVKNAGFARQPHTALQSGIFVPPPVVGGFIPRIKFLRVLTSFSIFLTAPKSFAPTISPVIVNQLFFRNVKTAISFSLFSFLEI